MRRSPFRRLTRCPGKAGWQSWWRQRRAVELRIAGETRYVAVEDAARYRDALGCALPVGLPAALTVDVLPPRHRSARRTGGSLRGHARALRGGNPSRSGWASGRLGSLRHSTASKRHAGSLGGRSGPDGTGTEWCDTSVLRTVRRRSLARLRHEVEPVPPEAYARFVAAWHSVDRPRRGADALADAITPACGRARGGLDPGKPMCCRRV